MNKIEISNIVEEIKKTIDLEQFKEVEKAILDDPTIDKDILKYCNTDKELKNKTSWAVNYLKIAEKNNLDILDIGCGCGWFPFVCRHFKHHVYLSDIAAKTFLVKDKLCNNNITIYDQILKILNLTRNYTFPVRPFQSIKLEQQFDVVSSLGMVYCNKWTINEWKFFVDDIIANLLKDKKETYIFLIPNRGIGLDNFSIDQNQLLNNTAIKEISFRDRIILISVLKN